MMSKNSNIAHSDTHKDNSYEKTLKSNFLFGGIKLFQVALSVIRIKIVAVILGPTGMGLQSLMTSTLASLFQFTTFGIFQSSVRDISFNSQRSANKTADIIKTLNTLALGTGLLGVIVCATFATPLSKLVFGNENFGSAFWLLGVALLFESLYNAKIATLQGLRKLKPLAKATVGGAAVGLVLSIPLYIQFKEHSIPFVLALNAAVIFLFYHLCSRSFSNIAPSSFIALNRLKELGTPIVKLGAVLMCSNGIMTIYSLALNSFINRVGSMSDVGLYNGAVTCTYGNIIVLVSILSADFYPRLSACIDNKTQFHNVINQQLELLLLIAAPLISLLIIFPKFVVDVLLSSEYHSIISMISLMALSLIFRIIWHTFSFVILAHGHRKTYFWFDAILGNGLVFVMNLIAYNLWGLDGLAYSYICGAMLMVAVLAILMHKKYELQLNRNVQWLALLAIVAVCAEYILKQAADKITVIPSVVLLIIISLFALVALNRKVQFVKLKSDKQ